MDSQTTTAIAYSGFVIGLASTIYAAINHKHVRSSCCGKKFDVSFDVDNSSPVKKGNALVEPINIPANK